MKGIFSDSAEWHIIVWGDWRDEKGNPSSYKPEEGLKEIHLTGGLGFYYYFTGRFRKAIEAYISDLEAIKEIEKRERIRYHKGLFYYQIGLCYKELGDLKAAKKFIGLAKRQDKITYGKFAPTYLASRIVI